MLTKLEGTLVECLRLAIGGILHASRPGVVMGLRQRLADRSVVWMPNAKNGFDGLNQLFGHRDRFPKTASRVQLIIIRFNGLYVFKRQSPRVG